MSHRFRFVVPGGLILLAISMLVLAYSKSGTSPKEVISFGTPILASPTATPKPGSTPEPTPSPVPQPTVSQGDRLSIPKLGIEGSLTLKIVPAPPDDVLPTPDGPDDVAYYSFPYHPDLGGSIGKGGNVIVSGHVDWGAQNQVGCQNNTVKPPCRAVFYRLKELQPDDIVTIFAGGVPYHYRVVASFLMTGERSLEWNRVLASTAQETLTMITCEGEFNPRTREYGERRVVQAVMSPP